MFKNQAQKALTFLFVFTGEKVSRFHHTCGCCCGNPISFCMIIYPRRKNFVDQRVFDREKNATNQLHQKRSILLTRVLGVTLFCPHARTSHLTTFARTHFARTRAFCPVALSTRTRTSKFST